MPAATSLPAAAQTTDWTGAASSNWFDASNWTNGVPIAGGAATVDATAPNAPVVNAPGAAANVVAVGLGSVGALTMTGGGTLSSVDGRVGLTSGSHGTVTVTGTGSNWSVSQVLYVGNSGTGMLTIEGGGTVSSLYGLSARFPAPRAR